MYTNFDVSNSSHSLNPVLFILVIHSDNSGRANPLKPSFRPLLQSFGTHVVWRLVGHELDDDEPECVRMGVQSGAGNYRDKVVLAQETRSQTIGPATGDWPGWLIDGCMSCCES